MYALAGALYLFLFPLLASAAARRDASLRRKTTDEQ
jgi:hypothetical protein